VSDGASAIVVCSEEGLKRCGILRNVEIMAWAHKVRNITEDPPDPNESSPKDAPDGPERCRTPSTISTIKTHDCFSIAVFLQQKPCR
jgi:hypothetical protein